MNLEKIRVNERIRAREVRVVDGTNNEQLGVMRTDEALKRARSMGLDLIEVAPTANPPVCRILNFGKFRYDMSKQVKEKRNHAGKVKEVKFRVNTGDHDYLTKIRHVEDFLDKGNKVKIHLQYRGRENAHKELGLAVLDRVRQDLLTMAHVDMDPKIVGRAASMTLSPLPAAKRKRKFAPSEVPFEEEEDDDDGGEEG